MTFNELTRVMLTSMDFFELRRTAARYGVPYQGVRRNKLVRDLERKIVNKSLDLDANMVSDTSTTISTAKTKGTAANKNDSKSKGATKKSVGMKINTYISGGSASRFNGLK